MCEYDTIAVFAAVGFQKGFQPICLLSSQCAAGGIKSNVQVLAGRKSYFKPVNRRAYQALEIIPTTEMSVMPSRVAVADIQ
jgi:hypothetical protein